MTEINSPDRKILCEATIKRCAEVAEEFYDIYHNEALAAGRANRGGDEDAFTKMCNATGAAVASSRIAKALSGLTGAG